MVGNEDNYKKELMNNDSRQRDCRAEFIAVMALPRMWEAR